jgi:hypothetical protein
MQCTTVCRKEVGALPVVGGGETSTRDAVELLGGCGRSSSTCACKISADTYFSSRSCEALATVLVVLYLDTKIGVEGCFFELLRCLVSQTTTFVCLLSLYLFLFYNRVKFPP